MIVSIGDKYMNMSTKKNENSETHQDHQGSLNVLDLSKRWGEMGRLQVIYMYIATLLHNGAVN